MKSIFDKVSNDCSKLVIKRYSTSFYFSSSLLSKDVRQDIFNIYGFVRLADEIVDTFHDFPKKGFAAAAHGPPRKFSSIRRLGTFA